MTLNTDGQLVYFDYLGMHGDCYGVTRARSTPPRRSRHVRFAPIASKLQRRS